MLRCAHYVKPAAYISVVDDRLPNGEEAVLHPSDAVRDGVRVTPR